MDMAKEEHQSHRAWYVIQEILFGIDIVVNFFVEYQDKGSGETVRNWYAITMRYVKGTFLWDLLAIFPFYEIITNDLDNTPKGNLYDYYHLIHLLKCLRLYMAVKVLSPRALTNFISKIQLYFEKKKMQ